MARRRPAIKRIISPDPTYGSTEVEKFTNRLIRGGKKSIARRAVYDAIRIVEKELERPGIEIFEQAIRNATPAVEVRPRRVGGATYQVPVEIRPERRGALAHRWLINAARERSGKPMSECLSQELADAANGTGSAVRRREEVHRMAEANRAFVHYRW